jgi:SAM-dependent methyltransferase
VRCGERVLDLAAGRGAVLFAAAERVGAQGRVIGVDLSERMIQETAGEIERRGVENAEMRQMDAESLAFPDESFDAVLCSLAFHLFPAVERVLAECCRVLHPGGRVGITRAGGRDPRWEWYARLLACQGVLLSLGTDAARGPSELADAMGRAGFQRVRVDAEEFDWVFTDEEEWWASLWTHGSRVPLEQMAPDRLEQTRATALAQARETMQPDGLHQTWEMLFALGDKPHS